MKYHEHEFRGQGAVHRQMYHQIIPFGYHNPSFNRALKILGYQNNQSKLRIKTD